jgi:transposase
LTWPAPASPTPCWPDWPAGGSRETPPASWRCAKARFAASRLALREASRALKANRAALDAIVSEIAPGLTSRPGIGPVSAARAIVSFSHAGRCRSEAAFARLAGTSPIEASSGQITRHRLNRGGDRALNRAIHVIARTRMRWDPATIAYVTRRRAQGKTDREIRRCIKRYIARQLYRALTDAMAPASTSAASLTT